MVTRIAFLRGVNVGGHRKMPMSDLRDLAAQLGFTSVSTYIQSGNLLFCSSEEEESTARRLEEAIVARWGYDVPVVVRSMQVLGEIATTNPFVDAAAREPNRVHLALARQGIAADAEAKLRSVALVNEYVERRGDAIWIHFGSGQARSKLTPAFFERSCASPVTLRNVKTIHEVLRRGGEISVADGG